MITIYGIPNCDKCRAARKWFAANGVNVRFHDLRADGLDTQTLEGWQTVLGDDALINKRSQTWRKIPEPDRQELDGNGSRQLMLNHPTLIKRPIVISGSTVAVGYDETGWTKNFLNRK